MLPSTPNKGHRQRAYPPSMGLAPASADPAAGHHSHGPDKEGHQQADGYPCRRHHPHHLGIMGPRRPAADYRLIHPCAPFIVLKRFHYQRLPADFPVNCIQPGISPPVVYPGPCIRRRVSRAVYPGPCIQSGCILSRVSSNVYPGPCILGPCILGVYPLALWAGVDNNPSIGLNKGGTR